MAAYQINVNEFARPKQVDPHPQQIDELCLWVANWEFSFQHAFKSIQLAKHGKEESVEVASDTAAVFSAEHLYVGIVWNNCTGSGFLFDADEFSSIFGVAVAESGTEHASDMLTADVGDVEFVEAAEDLLNLETVRGLISGGYRGAIL